MSILGGHGTLQASDGTRRWGLAVARDAWFSLGIHFDHAGPFVSIFLPGLCISVGRCRAPVHVREVRRGVWEMTDPEVVPS